MDGIVAAAGFASGNLLQPAVLFFALGAVAAFAGSDLALPKGAAKFLSLFLMLCIGFKGGVEARSHGFQLDFLTVGALGLTLSFLLPAPAFFLLRKAGLDRPTAAATAAHYGSVSVVTFAAAQSYLSSQGLAAGGYMPAVLALMETPALLTAIWLAMSGKEGPAASSAPRAEVWRHVYLNGATILLVGSFVIGLLTGAGGQQKLSVFVGPVFQGALCLFLLDLGVLAVQQLRGAGGISKRVLSLALILPILGASVALLAASALGLSVGDTALMAVLAGSASYIAAPAAMRLALPNAHAGTYLSLSLGITFPFNLLLGIPVYVAAANWIAS